MALREKTRDTGGTVQTFTDRMFRCVIKETGAGVEVWAEWEMQQPSGAYRAVAARADAEIEARILALPNLGTALDLVKENTYPKVVP
jgi:hypothetical protein